MQQQTAQPNPELKAAFHKDLLVFQKSLDPVKKDKKNGHFGNKYPTLNSVLEAILPAAHKNGFVVSQPVTVANTQSGPRNMVVTRLIHAETGLSEESQIVLPEANGGMKSMQEQGGAITYARRYGLIALCGLQDVDDDGETAVGRAPTKRGGVNKKDSF